MPIDGFDKLRKELTQASNALQALDGDLATVQFDPANPASVEAAIIEIEEAIDRKIAPFHGNAIVESLAAEMKEKYAQELLDRAAAARLEHETNSMSNGSIDPIVLRKLETAASDLRSAERQSFGAPLKRLSRTLHSDELEPTTRKLAEGIDVEAWTAKCAATAGSFVGSAELDWPDEIEKQLGTVIRLIDKFAADPDQAVDFSFTFYYSGKNITANLQNMVRQMIVPFVRDYIEYVKEQTGVIEPTLLPARTGPAARKIFIVHGHDEGAREQVRRYLERLHFEAIILHEQANRGRTIIEKIEEHGDVGFAVVLLTPDDVGGAKNQKMQPRARQNVLLELGYFIGRLTRSRVCALQRGDVEVPSDFGGVVYTPFDEAGAWKQLLGRELEAAGFEIDWNVAMRS